MSNEALYKSGFDFLRVIITMTLLLPGLAGLVNDYILFFIIYTSIWYFVSSIMLRRVDLFIDCILIRYTLGFWKKDKVINYSDVIELRHHSIPRGQDLLKIEYRDTSHKVKTFSFPCGRTEADMIMEEIRKMHGNISYTTH